MPGQTAAVGLREIGKPKKGETIFVSSASGAVGQMVIALSHRAGLKVIAAAGSDEKVQILKDKLGVEYAFNYKTTDIKDYLSKHEYQIYWDNVAGPTLEAVLDTISVRGEFSSTVSTCSDYTNHMLGFRTHHRYAVLFSARFWSGGKEKKQKICCFSSFALELVSATMYRSLTTFLRTSLWGRE